MSVNVGEIKSKIIYQVKDDPKISASTLAQNMSVTRRTIERYIIELREEGILIRHGSARGGYWEVID